MKVSPSSHGLSRFTRPPVLVLRPVSIRCTVQLSGAARGEVDRHARAKSVVVEKKALDVLAFVSERDHEFLETVPGVVLHDVPDDRVTTDLDHRLGPDLRLFGKTRSEPAGEDYDLHPS